MTDQKPVLLIDARNVMYRAIHASKREDRRNGGRRAPFVIMLRMIASLVTRYQPGMVQIFWDAPRKEVWRRAILETYKNRPDDHGGGDRDISTTLISTQDIARQAFEHLNVYQFYLDRQEADDLIYAACKLQGHRPMVIVSSDSDMQQIPYSMDSVRIYNHDKGKEMPRPTVSPVLIKALVGDISDCIEGYHGTGPVNAGKMAASATVLQEYLAIKGDSTLRRNLALIDMSLNPYTLKNIMYVGKVLATKPSFNKEKLMSLERSLRISGLSLEYGEIITPFKHLPNE